MEWSRRFCKSVVYCSIVEFLFCPIYCTLKIRITEGRGCHPAFTPRDDATALAVCCLTSFIVGHSFHFHPPLRYSQLGTTQEEQRFHSTFELVPLPDSRTSDCIRAIMEDGGRKHSPNDSYPTPTSTLQASTERILASHIPADTSKPDYELKKNTHIQFIARVMLQGFPSKYISQDASQPWLMFWILESFSILQVGLDPGNKQRSACPSLYPSRVLMLISPNKRQDDRHGACLSTSGWRIWRRTGTIRASVADVCCCVCLGYRWATRTRRRLGRN